MSEEWPPQVCGQCKAEGPDQVGLTIAEDEDFESEDVGLCSVACLRRFVEERYS